ncbi:ArpU family phage packaging/lysis transcriptional regulator [Paenibacillus apiarius]|uniref:ArpU family phage packaging/lysis transcriptional regulator n=1 Tax=Paenibacillus apiarius TaxID=46240 RepID=UPI003B3BB302
MADKEKRAALEKLFSRYRLYKRLERMGSITPETKITPSYEPRFHGNTNAISNPVEDAVLRDMEITAQRRALIGTVEQAVELLDEPEREIIQMRYMEKDYICDYHVHDQLGIGHPTYRRRRDAAVEKLYVLLEVVIMDERCRV